jgi:Spy/CpxP family protein refolding chaperone
MRKLWIAAPAIASALALGGWAVGTRASANPLPMGQSELLDVLGGPSMPGGSGLEAMAGQPDGPDGPGGPGGGPQGAPDRPDGPGGPGGRGGPGEFEGGPGHGPFSRLVRGELGRIMTLRAELNVTTAQRDQIKSILENHHQELASTMQAVVEKRRALRDAVISGTADEKAIRSAADDLGHAVGDAAVVDSKVKTEVAAVLTDQQKQKLSDFRSQSDHSVDEFLARMAGGR